MDNNESKNGAQKPTQIGSSAVQFLEVQRESHREHLTTLDAQLQSISKSNQTPPMMESRSGSVDKTKAANRKQIFCKFKGCQTC